MSNHHDIAIILQSQFRWDGPYSSISIAMAKEFAKTNRLFFVNHPYTWRDLGPLDAMRRRTTCFHEVDEYQGRLVSVDPPAVLPINFLGDNFLYRSLAKSNAAKVNQAIQDTLDTYKVEQYIYINCFDPFYPVKPQTSVDPLLCIYQSVDNIAESEYLKKHGPRLEQVAIAEADLCLVTSSELKRSKKVFNSNTKVLHNAADFDLFRSVLIKQFAKPAELTGKEGKIIGFIGNLDQQRVDYPLLLEISKKFPNYTLLLVGPINNTTAAKIGLTNRPNVIFTGGKKIEELPPYIQQMDCCLIPFHCNDLTKSIYPLKINEYLAAGKPVISTNFSEDISGFKDHIYLATTTAQFLYQIEQALQEDTSVLRQQRSQFAETNSWASRVKEFWEIVDREISQQVVSQ